jgi:hypothetical protein
MRLNGPGRFPAGKDTPGCGIGRLKRRRRWRKPSSRSSTISGATRPGRGGSLCRPLVAPTGKRASPWPLGFVPPRNCSWHGGVGKGQCRLPRWPGRRRARPPPRRTPTSFLFDRLSGTTAHDGVPVSENAWSNSRWSRPQRALTGAAVPRRTRPEPPIGGRPSCRCTGRPGVGLLWLARRPGGLKPR